MTLARTGSVLLFVVLLACRSPKATSEGWEEWVQADNAYAQRFQLWEHGKDRLVLVFGHGREQDTVGTYWLSGDPDGLPPPVRAARLSTTLSAVAIGSTTHVPYISRLGHASAIVACAHMDQVRDTAFAVRAGRGGVKEIATGDGLDREALLMLKPEALFGYPFGRGESSALEGLGIPTIEVSEYLEEHPLGRAEWLRFFGVLFGEERRADSLFAGIRERYEALRVDSSLAERPTVLFGSVWDGQWWVPPGNSYMARLIEDAGGRYVFADRKGDGNIAVDMETMLTVGRDADVWGMVAQLDSFATPQDFTHGDPRLVGFKCLKGQRLFVGNTTVSDIFGTALIDPDGMLREMKAVLRGHKYRDAVRPVRYFEDVHFKPTAQ